MNVLKYNTQKKRRKKKRIIDKPEESSTEEETYIELSKGHGKKENTDSDSMTEPLSGDEYHDQKAKLFQGNTLRESSSESDDNFLLQKKN